MASSIPAGGGGRGEPVLQANRATDLPPVQTARVSDLSVSQPRGAELPQAQAVRGGGDLAPVQVARGSDLQPAMVAARTGELQAAQVAARGSDLPPSSQVPRGPELPQGPGGRIDEGLLYGGGAEGVLFPQEGDDSQQPRKKTTSFKITNVFLSRPPSNDGDESAEELDDLEDSHTEDLSEMADSLSSQLEPLAAAAVQPLVNGVPQGWDQDAYHAHPGFGFVTYNQDAGYQVSYVDKTTGQLPIAGTMAVIVNNNSEQGSEVSEVPVSGPQDFKNRFKIVKVETTEPLKRGRWTCFDFVDKPAAKEKVTTVTSDSDKQVKTGTTTSTGGGPSTMSSASTMKTTSVASSRPASVAANLASTVSVAPVSTTTAGGQQHTAVTGSGKEQAGAPPAAGGAGQQSSATAGQQSAADSQGDEQQNVEGGQRSGPKSGGHGASSNGLAYSNHPSHSIPTQQNISSLTQVQSPSGMTAQLLGQVIRLPDGQLAQVALAPYSVLPQQAQQGGGNSNSGANYSNQTILLQPINPSQSNLPHKGVVMNSGGQLIVGSLVAQGQQQNGPTPSQSQTKGATSGGQTATGGGQSGGAGGQQPGSGQPTGGQQPSGQPAARPPAQSQPSGNGSLVIQHSGPPHQTSGPPHQTQQNLQHSQIQTLSSASSQPSQQHQKPAAHSAAQGMSHMSAAASGASIPPSQSATAGVITGGGGQLPPAAAVAPGSKNAIHSGQVMPSPVSSSSQQTLHVAQNAAGSHHQQQHTLSGGQQQQIAASSQSQPLSNSSSSNHQQQQSQPSVAAVSQQQAGQHQQAQNSSLQYSQQVPVVVSLQQSQQNRASQHQLNNNQQQAHSQQQHGNHVQQQQQSGAAPAGSGQQHQFNSTSAGSVVLQQQQNFHQQPQQLGILQQFSQQLQPQGSNGGSGYSQLHNNQLSSQTGNFSNALGSGQNSKQTSNGGAGAITLAGYTATLPTFAPLGGGGGEGLVEQLEISLLQDGGGGGEGKEAQQDLETDSSTGSGQGTIDNRIEQAMDLVKSHLMSAVRSEVEELRDKITKLEESVTVLSRENEYLRANVNQDVLASLSGARPHQPPDPNHQ